NAILPTLRTSRLGAARRAPQGDGMKYRGCPTLRDVGDRGLARAGLLARLRRVERGVLLAAQRLARELDQVVRREAHAEHRLDLPFAEGGARRLPELRAIVRPPADLDGDVPGERRAEPQAGQINLATHMQAGAVGCADT